jgi:hypothetical protein
MSIPPTPLIATHPDFQRRIYNQLKERRVYIHTGLAKYAFVQSTEIALRVMKCLGRAAMHGHCGRNL